MKRIIKYIVISLAIILLGVGGWIYYLFNMKDYATEDEKVSEVLESKYEIEMPQLETPTLEQGTSDKEQNKNDGDTDLTASTDGEVGSNTETGNNSSNNSSEDKNNTSHQPDESSNSNADQTANDNSDGSNQGSSSDSTLTKEQIKQSYRPAFTSLQQQATSKLNNLISTAISEYKAKKQNGENISFSYFYQKYTGAASNLEATTNSKFNQIYQSLQNDLKANGYDASAASEFKEAYEQAKGERKNSLLAKAKEAM